MKLSELINCEKRLADIEITGVYFDSRKVRSGGLFICLTGGAADGHDFAKMAEDNGAAAIVAERQTDSTLPHVIVEDTRVAMFEAAAGWYRHPEKKMKFIGVTGTNGKTSTVFYVKQILDALGVKTGLIGTVCNMIGDKVLPSSATTPEPLELMALLSKMADAGVEYAVTEVSSHSIVQKRVCGLHFTAAAFTNLTQDHLDYHGTMENYREAKFQLFQQADVAVLNIDDDTGKRFAERISGKKVTYSVIYNAADVIAKDVKVRAGGVKFQAVTPGIIAAVRVATPGEFTVYNALAAMAAVHAAGFEFSDILPAAARLAPVPGRAQIISGERPYSVMIDYAHTPDGLDNILHSLKRFVSGRIITVFGCGGDRDKTKRPIMGEKASALSDYVIVTSDNPRTEDPAAIIAQIVPGGKKHRTPFEVIENRREAIRRAIELAAPGDMVLLAGKGHEKYQILNTRRIDFDEEKIALEIMERLGK